MCKTLIAEAEKECERCQEAIDDICKDLLTYDKVALVSTAGQREAKVEEGSSVKLVSSHLGSTPSSSARSTGSTVDTPSGMSEAEIAETWNEAAAFELEHTHWGRIFTARCQEKVSVKKALDRLMKLRRDLTAEKAAIEAKLLHIAEEVPHAVATVQGLDAAAKVAVQLSKDIGASDTLRRSQMLGAVADLATSLITPAETIRKTFEREGWHALTLEEQQWVTVDQSMCPEKYSWLRQQQQEEDGRRTREGGEQKKKTRKNPAIDQCRFHRDELQRILAEPVENLNRREMHVRKLINKFHDDPQPINNADTQEAARRDVSTLAQRTRRKTRAELTVDEKEWISLDKILNPQVSSILYTYCCEDSIMSGSRFKTSTIVSHQGDIPRSDPRFVEGC